MNWKEAYTKIFLKEVGKSVNESTLQEYMPVWWQNTRNKDAGGLRLTDEGIEFVTEEVKLSTYDVPFPKDFGSIPKRFRLQLQETSALLPNEFGSMSQRLSLIHI